MKKSLIILIFALAASVCHGQQNSYELRPQEDTFVINPGPGNTRHINAADYNYGGAGSRSVAAATAYAILEDGQTMAPKGEYISMLRFDFAPVAGMKIDAITLQLFISNGNRSAYDLYNYTGHEGNFDLSWISNNWEQGTGAPHEIITYPYNSLNGVNFNSLQLLLYDFPARLLETFYYTAENPYGSPQWYEYTFDFTNGNYNQLRMAVSQGQTISFMLSASKGSNVCFNFCAYNQFWPGHENYRENGAKLIVDTETETPQVSNCYSNAVISGTKNIAGLNGFDRGGIENCYFTGNVIGNYNDPNNCIGPIIGNSKTEPINSFWNIDTVELPSESYTGGLTDEEMMNETSFAMWSFKDQTSNNPAWKMIRNDQDYPRLIWQYQYPGDITGKYGVDPEDLTLLIENWLTETSNDLDNVSDINRDGITSVTDFAILATDWLKGL